VWQVLRALRAHDEALAEELDELRRELGRRRTSIRRPSKIKLDLPTAVGGTFARAFDSRLVEQTTASWEFWFGLLERYDEREHDALVSQKHLEDGYPLGHWVSTQRASYRDCHLSTERKARLAAIPGWDWRLPDALWEEGFAHVERFVEREGHARVPAKH